METTCPKEKEIIETKELGLKAKTNLETYLKEIKKERNDALQYLEQLQNDQMLNYA